MLNIFKLIKTTEKGKESEPRVSIGLDVRIGSRELSFPLSEVCRSYEELEARAEEVRKDLQRVMQEAEAFFSGSSLGGGMALPPGTPPEKIWTELSKIGDEDFFVSSFNDLDDRTRRGVADYILTKCNIFSGKGAVFSGRYNNESGLLE